MTPEQIEKWKQLVEVARWGMSEHKSVIVDLALLQAIEKLLLDKIPGWNQNMILPWWHPGVSNEDVTILEKQWEA